MRDILRLGVILMLIGAGAAGALAIVNSFTEPRILAQKELALQNALREVLPDGELFEEVQDVDAQIPANLQNMIRTVYLAKADGHTVGIVATVLPPGYNGTLTVLVGIDGTGTLAGVQVIDQKETPGLGSRVVEPEFLAQEAIAGTKITDTLLVRKDGGRVDAVTGATISSRAVLRGINTVGELYRILAPGLGLALEGGLQ